ncbi:MAG TPA: DedA family protein [Candidatus Limnocylindrales bacterium]|nr:DedA family protein [Candidatus Limnocylindrales bacterium]
MDILTFVLHLDEHLTNIVNQFGTLTYGLIFLVIFAETGFVVTPFLPGDSLLFAVGALSASGILNIWIIYFLLLAAAILGDTANYWIGKRIGPKVFSKKNSRIFNQEYLAKTENYYAKYGGKTIIIARFLPIVRTFAPFVAGVGRMNYKTFFLYNVIGGFIWVTTFVWLGFFFGRIQIIKDNFEFAVIGIILFSLIPVVYEYISHKKDKSNHKKTDNEVSYKDVKKTFEKENFKD